jgi:hypothetical protein
MRYRVAIGPTVGMLVLSSVLSVAGACRYAGPFAPGRSEIQEGSLPGRVARWLGEGGGALTLEELLPPGVTDSAVVYLVVVDQRAIGIENAKVAVLPHAMSMPNYPKDGWQPVGAHGVYAKRLVPGEYVVYVQDPFHWSARKLVRFRAGSIDTLLAVMRSAVEQGSRTFQPVP